MLRMEGRAPRKCPLCPRKQTFSEATSMSAKCQKRTSAPPIPGTYSIKIKRRTAGPKNPVAVACISFAYRVD